MSGTRPVPALPRWQRAALLVAALSLLPGIALWTLGSQEAMTYTGHRPRAAVGAKLRYLLGLGSDGIRLDSSAWLLVARIGAALVVVFLAVALMLVPRIRSSRKGRG